MILLQTASRPRVAPPRRRLAAALALVAAALLITGCGPGAGALQTYTGPPHEIPESDLTGENAAFYISDGSAIAIVMWGSSTCPVVGTRMHVVQDAGSGNTVKVEVADTPSDQPCTADLVPQTTVFATPADVTTTEPLTIQLPGSEIVLPVK